MVSGLLQSIFRRSPINILEKSLDVIRPLQPVVDHEGVLKDIEDEDGCAARGMPHIVLINPEIEKSFGKRILVEDGPADAAHRPDSLKLLLPGFVASKILRNLLVEIAGLGGTTLSAKILKIVLMKPHPVEFPSESPFQFGKFGGPRFAIL